MRYTSQPPSSDYILGAERPRMSREVWRVRAPYLVVLHAFVRPALLAVTSIENSQSRHEHHPCRHTEKSPAKNEGTPKELEALEKNGEEVVHHVGKNE